MNESILLALKELIADVKSKPNDTRYATKIKKAEEAIKKFEDSSGKETGMKWVKASERLPEKNYNYFVRVFYFNDPKQGTYNAASFWDGKQFIDALRTNYGQPVPLVVSEWLDESVPPYKEEEASNEILNSLSELVRTISRAMNKKEFVKDVDEPRLEKAKSILVKYADKNQPKIVQSNQPYKEEVDKENKFFVMKNAIENKLRQTDVCFGDCDNTKECTHTGHGCYLWSKYAQEITEMIFLESKEEAGMKKGENPSAT